MKIHTFSSLPHYREHCLAIWKHLPDSLRGEGFINPRDIPRQADPDDIFLIAGAQDIYEIPNNRIIYVEHGAGQRYEGLREKHREHYHGSHHPNRVIAYIAPRQEVADSWGRPAFATGSPVCDPYQLFGEEGVVAITFHWNAGNVCPETRSALDHYANHMPWIIKALRSQGYEVLGHRHPRYNHLSEAWRDWGVDEVDVDTVRRRASILIADNTSLAYEMLYLGRLVVTLNAPWYRRDVDHGLRFWDWVPGMGCDDPQTLLNAIEDRFPYLSSTAVENEITARYVYGQPFNDGMDGLRAASWIVTQVGA